MKLDYFGIWVRLKFWYFTSAILKAGFLWYFESWISIILIGFIRLSRYFGTRLLYTTAAHAAWTGAAKAHWPKISDTRGTHACCARKQASVRGATSISTGTLDPGGGT